VRIAIIDNVQIAVVDNDPLTRDFIVNVMMYSVNRDVLVFETAAEIEAHLQSGNRVHLIFTDVYLPGKSGFELLRQIKQRYPDICLIAMSANPGDETPATGMGADVFLARPFALQDLFDIVQQFVVERSPSPVA
jgi:CheY-like chemotaxis protein